MSRRIPLPVDAPPKEYFEKKEDSTIENPQILYEKINDMIPPKSIYGHDLKRLKSYRNIRQGYKLKNQKQIFINDISNILKTFDEDSFKMNIELLAEILQIAEEYFIYGDREQRENSKMEAISELMKKYFKDDEDFLFSAIEYAYHRVSKSNIFKRILARTWLFFKRIN